MDNGITKNNVKGSIEPGRKMTSYTLLLLLFISINIQTTELSEIYIANKNIRVFRSNINDKYKAAIVCAKLKKMDGVHRVNVDVDDWENILRLECDPVINEECIHQVVLQLGYDCDEL